MELSKWQSPQFNRFGIMINIYDYTEIICRILNKISLKILDIRVIPIYISAKNRIKFKR
jgi:hypothetical protein